MALLIQLTNAGLAAVTAAAGTEQTVIAQLALTATPFVAAPTLTAIPGEFKRLDILSGVAASPNVAHITAYDTSDDTWSATGFGLFLDDGTLFAAYSALAPVLSKAEIAFALMAFDIGFNADILAEISFGDATFVWPPATMETRGVARIATQARVDAADDDDDDAETIVTPKTLRARLLALSTSIGEALATLTARKVTGGGLVTGGGDLSQDRTLRVEAASAADILAGTSMDSVVTPGALAALQASLPDGVMRLTNGWIMQIGEFTVAAGGNVVNGVLTFPLAFPQACISIVGTARGPANASWHPIVVMFKDDPLGTATASYTIDSANSVQSIDAGTKVRYIAIGK